MRFKMIVVIVEIDNSFDQCNISNVYGPFSEEEVNDRIIEIEKTFWVGYHPSLEIMPLIKKIS